MAPVGPNSAIHLFHHSFLKTGGKERYAIALASAFRHLGHPVTVHAVRGDEALARELGLTLDLVPCPRFPRKLQPFHFFRRVDRLRQGLGGVHVALSRVRVKDVLVSGGTHLAYLRRGQKWTGPFDGLQVWMERQAYRAARRLVAHSDLIAGDLRRYYRIGEDRIRTLYAPVDERFLKGNDVCSRAELRRALGWPDDRVVFLFPSSGHSRKGLGPIAEAFRFFEGQAVLAVAGKPAGSRRAPWLRSMGYIEDMASAYRAADFTLLGSFYEPFGLVGPESILCGTRLVFEREIGCLAAIDEEYVQTFDVGDPGSIRKALAEAIQLAHRQQHRIEHPERALRYDPRPEPHARAVLAASADALGA